MGITRGSFEHVLETREAARPAVMSTSVPDVGAPLLEGAKAMGSWANLFGKLSKIGTDYTTRHNVEESQLHRMNASEQEASVEYRRAQTAYDEAVRNYGGDNATPEQKSMLKSAAGNLNAARMRYETARTERALQQDRFDATGFFGFTHTPTASNIE